MAEKVGSGHNLHQMKADLRNADQEIFRLEVQIAELREQIKEIKAAKVKPYMSTTEFNIARRYRAFDDADERNEALDNLRVAFEALEIGGQLDMFGGAKTEDAAA